MSLVTPTGHLVSQNACWDLSTRQIEQMISSDREFLCSSAWRKLLQYIRRIGNLKHIVQPGFLNVHLTVPGTSSRMCLMRAINIPERTWLAFTGARPLQPRIQTHTQRHALVYNHPFHTEWQEREVESGRETNE